MRIFPAWGNFRKSAGVCPVSAEVFVFFCFLRIPCVFRDSVRARTW